MVTVKIANQKPATLYDSSKPLLPVTNYTDDNPTFSKTKMEHIHNVYIQPLYENVQQGQNVSIKVEGKDIQQEQIEKAWDIILHDTLLDADLLEQMNTIYQKSMRYAPQDQSNCERILQHEAMVRNRLPLPVKKNGRSVRYTATHDVIPSAKGLYSQTPTNPADIDMWTASLSGFMHEYALNNALVVTVRSNDTFEELRKRVVEIGNKEQKHLNKTEKRLYDAFGKTTLNNELTLGITLPHGGLDGKTNGAEPYQLNRALYNVIAEMERTHTGECFVTPVTMSGLFKPSEVLFVNAERIMHASPKEIAKTFEDLKKAFTIAKRLPLVTNKQLATTKNIHKLTNISMNYGQTQKVKGTMRQAISPVKAKPVTKEETIKMIVQVAKRHTTQSQTENSYKTETKTFMRANRRKPFDPTVAGKTKRTIYRPDLHIYLDTSGSINESMYQDSINALIQLALTLDVNLYFTSFADKVSETTLLQTKNRSAQDIYKKFQLVPKVSGGTNFEAVWAKINLIDEHNKRNGQSYQLNFVITDFGYYIKKEQDFSSTSAHRDQTYYVPISTNEQVWETVSRWATKMMKDMNVLGHQNVRRHFLM